MTVIPQFLESNVINFYFMWNVQQYKRSFFYNYVRIHFHERERELHLVSLPQIVSVKIQNLQPKAPPFTFRRFKLTPLTLMDERER
jgi:hypothetical protein